MRRSTQPMAPRFGPPCCKNTAHNAGDKVSAFNAEIAIAADRDRELPEQGARHAGDEGDRHKHRKQNQRDRKDRTGNLRHRLFGGVAGRELRIFLHDALDVFDDDDRVVDEDADRQHHRQKRNRVGRIAHRQQYREAADDADRHRDRWDQGRAQRSEKQEHHNHNEDECYQQRDQHVLDRVIDKRGRVVIDDVFETGRKTLAQSRHIGAHQLCGRDGIGARREISADRDRRLAIEASLDVLAFRAEFDPCHILDPQQRAVGIGAQYDVAELFRCDEPPLRLDIELELLFARDRPGADAPDRRDDVLRLDCRDNIAGSQLEIVEPLRVQPDSH